MSKFTLQVKGDKEVKSFLTLNLLKNYLVEQTSNWWLAGAFGRMFAQKILTSGYAEIELDKTYIIERVAE